MESPPPSKALGGRPGSRWHRHLLITRTSPNASGAGGWILLDRRRPADYDEAGRRQMGRAAAVDPGPVGPESAMRRTAFRACRVGAPSRPRRCSSGTGRSRRSPARASDWDVAVRGSVVLAATLQDRWTRPSCTGPWPGSGPTRRWPRRPSRTALAGDPRGRWQAFCDEIGLAQLRLHAPALARRRLNGDDRVVQGRGMRSGAGPRSDETQLAVRIRLPVTGETRAPDPPLGNPVSSADVVYRSMQDPRGRSDG